MAETNLGEYRLSFNYGNGGFCANNPVILTRQQVTSLGGARGEIIADVLKSLLDYHQANTNQQHPLKVTPVSEIVPGNVQVLEVMLRRIESRQPV